MVSIAGFGMAFTLALGILFGIDILTNYYDGDYNSMFLSIFWWDDSLPILGHYSSNPFEYIPNVDFLGVIFAVINAIFGVEILGLSLTKVLLLIYNTFKLHLVYYKALLPLVKFKMARGAPFYMRG